MLFRAEGEVIHTVRQAIIVASFLRAAVQSQNNPRKQATAGAGVHHEVRRARNTLLLNAQQ